MLTLKNEQITARFSETGAELKSLVYGGKEHIWQSDPAVWPGACPLMFPICGGLKEDSYILNGKEYTLEKHGYARHKTFEVESSTDSSIVFLLRSDDESRAQFPFEYELRIIYTLSGRRLTVRNEVKNLSEDTMYFSIGSHEGYACDEGIEAYDIILPQKEKLYAYQLHGNLLGEEKELILDNDNVLPLDYKYFAVDALVFKDIVSRSVILKNRNTGRAIRVEFDGFFNLMLWTKPGAGYICVEPWNGIPDRTYSDRKFITKEGIQQVTRGQTYIRTHSIEIL